MVGERKARKTAAWRLASAAIWRAMPSRGLAMNSLRLGWTVGGAAGGGWAMTRVSRFQTESSRKESAADQDRCWASASPKPPRKRWRAEVSMPGEEVKEASLSVARMDRKSTRLNSSHLGISYAVFCLKKNKK